MKILVIPDSFKGSLSAKEVALAIKKGIQRARGNIDLITLLPFSDGGEGFLETLAPALEAEIISGNTVNALGKKIKAQFGWIETTKTGIIEFAQASGLTLVGELNPLLATSFGTGTQILELLNKGAKKIIIGLGGSATNDGGLGICLALGIKFLDVNGTEILTPDKLYTLHYIDLQFLDEKVKTLELLFACDVKNPLTGPNGATTIFGPQKGVDEKSHVILEAGLLRLSEVLETQFQIKINDIEGSGAAGGVCAPLFCILKSEIKSGFNLLSNEFNLRHIIKESDLIITGEGCLDMQSFNGKLIGNLVDICDEYFKNVLIICGESKYTPNKSNIKTLNITSKNTSKIESIQNAKTYVEEKIYGYLIV